MDPRKNRSALGLGGSTGWGLFVGLLIAAASVTYPWRAFEERAEGIVLRNRPLPWNDEVIVVEVDQATIDHLGWPVPRSLHARLVRALAEAGAKVVAYDLFFLGAGIEGSRGDLAFAQAARDSAKVIFAVPCIDDPMAKPIPAAAIRGLPHGPISARSCLSIVPPYGSLSQAGSWAQVEVAKSASGYARGAYLFGEASGVRVPALGLAAYWKGKGRSLEELEQHPRELQLDGWREPVSEAGSALVSFRELPGDAFVGLGEAIEGIHGDPPRFSEPLRRRFEGRHVIIGQTAESVRDRAPLATGQILPLVTIHAALLSDLLEHRVVRELPAWCSLLVVLAVGAWMTWVTRVARPSIALAASLVTVLGTWGCCFLLWSGANWIVPPLGPSVAAVAPFAAALASRLSREERQRRFLTDAFGAYVDEGVLDQLLADPDRYLSLGGAEKELTVLFADIQGYTGISNRLPAEQVLAILREYLDAMMVQVRARGGRIDKIMGDGLLAVFGDPIPFDDHPARAVDAALAMQAALLGLQSKWRSEGKPELTIRIGIATGPAFVGNIGSRATKLEYAVLGPTVNLASRLEGKCPAGGILVSEATQQACASQFELEPVPALELKGFEGAQRAFVVVGKKAFSAA